MTRRSYSGPDYDGTVQYITEAPAWQGDGETVDIVDDAPVGEETTENVPVPDGGTERPDVDGQSTWADWEGSA
mgnify:CR=1 FL=1